MVVELLSPIVSFSGFQQTLSSLTLAQGDLHPHFPLTSLPCALNRICPNIAHFFLSCVLQFFFFNFKIFSINLKNIFTHKHFYQVKCSRTEIPNNGAFKKQEVYYFFSQYRQQLIFTWAHSCQVLPQALYKHCHSETSQGESQPK